VASSGRTFASPLARKVAVEQGVPIAAVAGTGPNNRVIRADVVEYAAKTSSGAALSAAAPVSDQYTDIPTTQIRKVIAARLTESKQTVPHYYLTVECRVDKLLRLRQELNSKSDGSYKLSVNDFIIKAAALALKKKPTCNSAWFGDYIRRYHNVDINVAVSTDDGLFTPIVHDADKKGLASIANTVKELANKAKEKKLQPHEFQGGTFTISNLGMFGVKHFAAVINPPQSCILAIGATEKRVIPNEDKETSSTQPYTTASVLSVTLSADHRVVDGAVGADWLQSFKEYMEDPVKMLL
jgi:pyruvate dehydrogenase E2 component (dihydrolipoamide acetyltransferase)